MVAVVVVGGQKGSSEALSHASRKLNGPKDGSLEFSALAPESDNQTNHHHY